MSTKVWDVSLTINKIPCCRYLTNHKLKKLSADNTKTFARQKY